MKTATRKRRATTATTTGTPRPSGFRATVEAAALAEPDARLRAWLLKLCDGDRRERGKN